MLNARKNAKIQRIPSSKKVEFVNEFTEFHENVFFVDNKHLSMSRGLGNS